MLQPKKQKYRKHFRGKRKGLAVVGSSVDFGDVGLKAVEGGWITAQQIEASRKTISHATKRAGKVWVRIFPDKSYSKKASGSKMGGGKGDIEGYVAVVKPGRVLFEITGVAREISHKALWLAGRKLPIKTKIVDK